MERRSGFTLVELLVVVTIIGVLIALLLPAVQAARAAARRMSCQNNQKQVGLALLNYHDTFEVFPPGYIANQLTRTSPVSAETGTGYSWATILLPFQEQQPLHRALDFSQDCRDLDNLKLAKRALSAFRCPEGRMPADSFTIRSEGKTVDVAYSSYVGMFGYGSLVESPGWPDQPGVFYRNSAVRAADIRDGLSNTILLGERTYRHDFVAGQTPVDAASTWYAAVPGTMRPAGLTGSGAGTMEGPASLVLGSVGQPATGAAPAVHQVFHKTNHIGSLSSRHFGGINVTAGDGSIHFLHDSIDYGLYRSLGQHSDGVLGSGFER